MLRVLLVKHVVELMKTDAVIGGEGNGGVIYPNLHYGRDALVGIALFLSNLVMWIARFLYCEVNTQIG